MRIINDIYKATCRFCLFVFFVLASCAIENDIPYPIVNAGITDIRVEGQRPAEGSSDDAALIDASAKTILLYVNDSVDISRLKLTRLVVNPRDAQVLVDSALCANPNKFPFAGFASLDSIPMSSNTRVDFTKPVNFTIKTYQDYVWQVKVKQIIDRKVEAKGMIDYSIDELDNRVIIYVGKGENLKNISITSLALGGAYGEVTPNPTTVKDFTSPQKFLVQYPWSEPNKGTIWTVYVRLTDEEGGSQPSAGDLSVNAWSKYAFVEGKATEANCSFEYVKQGETSSRPFALHGFFQYAPVAVTHIGDNQPAGTLSKGDMDVCSIYIALAKESYTVDNTKAETFIQFKTDNNIIAYGELPLKECVSTNGTWKEFTIDLEYKTLEKPNDMYLIVVASASKYGDYFTGGDGSILYVDDFELIYD